MTRRVPRAWRRFFHVDHGTPYHVENSLSGLAIATKAGLKAIDWDVRVTKDGVIVLCHWKRPMLRDGFRAPKGSRLRRWRTVESMTWSQVSRLRTKDGHRIESVLMALTDPRLRDFRVELEAKDSPRLGSVVTWQPVAALVNAYDLDVQVKTLTSLDGAYGRLYAAHLAGLTTILSHHGRKPFRLPRRWVPAVDYIRGRWVHA